MDFTSIKFRVLLIVAIAGGALVFMGIQEAMVSAGTTLEPMSIELADIEVSQELENNHLLIGEHWAVYPECVYEYKTSSYNTEASATSTVNYALYPIISSNHPFLTELWEKEETYGSIDAIPEEKWPEFKDFPVLVKTSRFSQIKDIPENWTFAESIQGLVINRIRSLSGEEQNLIKESFPTIDFSKVLILEDGRKPGEATDHFAMITFGLILIGIAVFKFIKAGKVETASATPAQPQSTPPQPEKPKPDSYEPPKSSGGVSTNE